MAIIIIIILKKKVLNETQRVLKATLRNFGGGLGTSGGVKLNFRIYLLPQSPFFLIPRSPLYFSLPVAPCSFLSQSPPLFFSPSRSLYVIPSRPLYFSPQSPPFFLPSRRCPEHVWSLEHQEIKGFFVQGGGGRRVWSIRELEVSLRRRVGVGGWVGGWGVSVFFLR